MDMPKRNNKILLQSRQNSRETILVPLKSIRNCEELSQKIDEFAKNHSLLCVIEKSPMSDSVKECEKLIEPFNQLYVLIPDKIDKFDQNDIFVQLNKKNIFFKFLIERFMYQKAMELENVTGTTLDTVLSIDSSFGDLALALKKFIFKKVSSDFYKKYGKHYVHILKDNVGQVHFALSYKVMSNEKVMKNLVVSVDDKAIRLWNWKTGLYDHVHFYEGIVSDIDHSVDGRWLAIANGSKNVTLLNSQTYITTILPHEKSVNFVSWDHLHDVKNQYSCLMTLRASNNNRAYLWNITESAPILKACFSMPKNYSKKIGRRFSDLEIHGKEIYCFYTSKHLTLCNKALSNSATKKEIKKLGNTNRVQNLPIISRHLFKAATNEKLLELAKKQKIEK